MPRYSIRKNRIRQGYLDGFDLDEQTGELKLNSESLYHCIFLRGIDGIDTGARWGRISFKAVYDGEVVCCIYAAAVNFDTFEYNGEYIRLNEYFTDSEINSQDKILLLKRMGAKRFVGSDDVLLYELEGQYLYFAIEVTGEGNMVISNLFVDSIGDNFMDTFPEIYVERNSFFHRYMSIFSSIYNDFDDEIDHLPDMLNLDICPVELLVEYASWMGIDLKGGYLSEKVIRSIVKEAYSLNKMKGTRAAMERILQIILNDDCIIIEHNLVRSWLKKENAQVPAGFKPKSIYDVTVLIKGQLNEDLRHQLIYILRQFVPARTRLNIAQMDEHVIIDSNSYLDINAKLPEQTDAILDKGTSLDGTIVLS